MFSQQQDGRQQMPGMHTGMQMIGGRMPSNNIQQQAPGNMQAPMIGSVPINPSGGPQQQQQINTFSGVKPVVNLGNMQQPGNILPSNSDLGPTGSQPGQFMQIQRMSAPNQQQNTTQENQNSNAQAAQLDRIVQFKQLLPQLKECLVTLISVARQNFAANATIDNLEKSIDTTLLPRFDKALEQFYSICNQIEVHLMLASDQISHTLCSMQYTPLNATQMRDNAHNLQVYNNYINTVKQQLAYAKEIQNMLNETSSKIAARQGAVNQKRQ